jgi:hypothetical protein
MASKSRRRDTNLSLFKRELRKLLKKHKKSALSRSVSRKKSKANGKRKKKSLAKYRSSTRRNNNNVYGGAVRDGSPQQFLKC